MRIFLTGASGYVGSAILDASLRAGHQVTALVRDPEKAEHVSLRGGRAIVGELGKPSGYVAAAEESDVIVHAAYDRSKRSVDVDRRAIETLLGAAGRRIDAGQSASCIYTSGIWVLGNTDGPAAEDAPLNPTPLAAWRPEHEGLVRSLSRSGQVRIAIVRPGIVYGGARGIISDLLKNAKNGLVRVVGDGSNHWPCVYDRDLADLYVRLAAHPDASGIFHANDEADERVSDIVEAIARHIMVQPDVRHVPIEEARAKMGQYADALALDQRVRSPRSRSIGWSPSLRSVAGNAARLFDEWRRGRAAA